MRPVRRAGAALVLVSCILGGVLVAYPLAHGHYGAGGALALLVVAGVMVYGRLTKEMLGYSNRAAVVGAIAGLVVAGNILVRTDVGRPGGLRTVGTQALLLFAVHLAGSIGAFLASFVSLALRPGTRGRAINTSERDA